jgi:ankyrin repeat protein
MTSKRVNDYLEVESTNTSKRVRSIVRHQLIQDEYRRDTKQMHLACKLGDIDTVSFLFNKNNSLVETSDINGRTPIFHAATENRIHIISFLLSTSLVNINTVDNHGKTALIIGCENGSYDFIFKLLKQRDINVYIIDKAGNTAFHYLFLSLEKHRGETQIYIHGSMPGTVYCYGAPLFENHNSIIKILQLLNHKFPEAIRYCDEDGQNILHSFARRLWSTNEYIDIVFNLVKDRLNDRDKNGCTPMHFACKYFIKFRFQKFINMTCIDVNIQDKFGKTALHYYCERPYSSRMSEQIIGHPTTRTFTSDIYGNTALHTLFIGIIGKGHRYEDEPHLYEKLVTKYLEADKFIVFRKNCNGNTALDEAVFKLGHLIELQLEIISNDVRKCIDVMEKCANEVRIIMFNYFQQKFILK